jgi:hypothetical protein
MTFFNGFLDISLCYNARKFERELDIHLGSKQPALELLYAHKRVNFKQTIFY